MHAPTSPAPIVEGDEQLDVSALYRDYAHKVAAWAGRLGGPGIEAEDIVQEVFLVAKRRLSRFRADGGKITTWLFRATDRIVKAARRKQRLRRLFGTRAAELASVTDIARAGQDDALERRQEVERVYRILDCLPERQRRVLVLFELEGLSTHDIAELTGARLGTVRVWLYRARASFLEHHQRLTENVDHGKDGRKS